MMPKNTNTRSAFILHVPPVFCFEQGLCYVYVAESEAHFLAEMRTDSVVQDSVRTRRVKSGKMLGKAKLTFSDASERVKEMQCFLLHYV